MTYDPESHKCGVCKVPHFERNNYFHGKSLGTRELAKEQSYFNEKRWLINRMIHGWGIVCGLDVCLESGCLVVEPGLALDCCGRELLVCEQKQLAATDIAGELNVDPCGDSKPIPWALCLEYRECYTEPVKPPPSCDQNERGREYNCIRDDYRLSVRLRDDACPEDHCAHLCPHDGLPGRDACIHKAVEKSARECPECKKCHCVILATGTFEPGKDGPQLTLDDDHWKYRRVVYRNPTLGNLIECFHGGLAHIKKMDWEPGDRYKIDEFLDKLKDGLTVTFDREMERRTVRNPRTCRLSIFIPEEKGRCPTHYLIPVDYIDYDDCVAVYHFDEECVEHELKKACKKLRKEADVELILHGSMIHAGNDRALDAEYIDDFPTGNGSEGGEFIAYFTVVP